MKSNRTTVFHPLGISGSLVSLGAHLISLGRLGVADVTLARKEGNVFGCTHSGLLQSLSALWAPAPHVLEQWDQGDQRPQPPGTLSGFFPTVIHLPAMHHWKEKRRRSVGREGRHGRLSPEPWGSDPKPPSKLPTVKHHTENKDELIKEFPP